MSATVQKILIVGEHQTGKSSLVQSFLDYDGTLNQSIVERGTTKKHTMIN